MAKIGRDKNYVSFWFWIFAFLVLTLPCIGFIMVFVWAFVGENESRKNYFRAMIAWGLFVMVLWFVLMAFGFWPEIERHFQLWLHRFTK